MAVTSKFAKAELERIKEARQLRSDKQEYLNAFYSLALPHRAKIGENRSARYSTDDNDQDDIFDGTLQECVCDFASDQADFFIPDYRPWCKTEVSSNITSPTDRKELLSLIKQRDDKLYELIAATNFYEEAYEIFHDVAGSAGGVIIPDAPRIDEVRVRPVFMSGLIMDDLAYSGIDGRWSEYEVKSSQLKSVIGKEAYDKYSASSKKVKPKGNAKLRIIQGCRLKETKQGYRWLWATFVDDVLVQKTLLPPATPPPLAVARWRASPPNPWGPGPAYIAIPAARTLDELTYLNLRKLAKEADPPMSFEADGVFNPENGIDNGTFVARRAGSQAPSALYEPSKAQNAYFTEEGLTAFIKRALYQDKPEQPGKTPPTASQWIDEKTMYQRRQQARRRIYREFVLPVLRRFEYVFTRRGQLEPIIFKDEAIKTTFVSPLSKSSDANEVSTGIQFAQSTVGLFSETALASIDVYETMVNWQNKLEDTTVVLKQPDQQGDLIKQMLGEGRNIVQ